MTEFLLNVASCITAACAGRTLLTGGVADRPRLRTADWIAAVRRRRAHEPARAFILDGIAPIAFAYRAREQREDGGYDGQKYPQPESNAGHDRVLLLMNQ